MVTKFDKSPDGILELLSQGEGQTVEFKRGVFSDADIAKNLVAFANKDGGILLVGVSEDGAPVGLSIDEAGVTFSRLARIASSLLDVPSEVGTLPLPPGRQMVYVMIERIATDLAPVSTSRGEVYVREGNINVGVSEVASDGPLSAMAEASDRAGSTPEGVPTESLDRQRLVVFVAMSFREEEEPALIDYYLAMDRAVSRSRLPLDLVRIDLEEGDYEISQEVMDRIDQAQILIADFTLNAANVYLEAGYARGRDKRIIQTARKDTVLEFDVRNWKTLFYRNAAELEEKLIPALHQAHSDVVRT